MTNFTNSERRCQATFQSCAQAFHAYTSGKDTPIVFTSEDDLTFAMNAIAYTTFTFRETITIIAFAVMSNHFHFIVNGSEENINAFFKFLVKKIKTSIPAAAGMAWSLKPIEDLASMRNNIAYTNRNGYVANPAFTPFSYPWGTGRYYYNAITTGQKYSDVRFENKRSMMRGRSVQFPDDWVMTDGYISPTNYCALQFGMAMFRDAHHYFAMISKNVESYSGIAAELDDSEFLTDQELYSQVQRLIQDKYHIGFIRDLSKPQKYDLARTLRYEFRSSNGQIRRTIGLSEFEINSLFPKG